MDTKTLTKKIIKLNKNGEFSKKIFNEYYEQSNVLMTVVNVITEFVEKLVKKQFSISMDLRILNLSENEKIYIIINKLINMITVKNTQSNSSIVILIKDIEKDINKNNSILFNYIIYNIFEENVSNKCFNCFEQTEGCNK